MRLALGGYGGALAPLVIPFTSGGIFAPSDYLALGYKNYDVMCIGGAGGRGGGMIPLMPYAAGSWFMKGGGGGGGGGLMRASGRLVELPSSVVVVVGQAGAFGRNSDTPGSLVGTSGSITDGVDGGASSFNGVACQASGGKGGKGVTSAGSTGSTGANGGAGGAGGTTTAGGGAAGGAAGNIGAIPSGDAGSGGSGAWDGKIGTGGGGGGGGAAQHSSGTSFTYVSIAGQGGRGSYSLADTTVFGDQGYGAGVTPGSGGGAKTTPLDHLLKQYGSFSDANGNISQNGIVVISLTE